MNKKWNGTQDIRTYLAKTNTNGNRHTIIINHTTKEFLHRGLWMGDYGKVTSKLKQKDIKAHLQFCKENGYKELSSIGYEFK